MSNKIKLALIVFLVVFCCTYFFTKSSLSYKFNPYAVDDIQEKEENLTKGHSKVLAAEPLEKGTYVQSSFDVDDQDSSVGEMDKEKPAALEDPDAQIDTPAKGDKGEPLWDKKLVQQLSFLQSPIPGAKISSRDSQLPGAPRTYRNGTHEGLDYYDGFCGVPVHFGDPVYAAGAGIIIRVDHNYKELPMDKREEMLRASAAAGDTPEDILDKLRGRQVWIVHAFDVVTRYAHLDTVSENIQVGDWVEAGDFVGTIGNSGTSNGARGTRGDAHLHFEIWIENSYLGEGLPPEEVRSLWHQVLSAVN